MDLPAAPKSQAPEAPAASEGAPELFRTLLLPEIDMAKLIISSGGRISQTHLVDWLLACVLTTLGLVLIWAQSADLPVSLALSELFTILGANGQTFFSLGALAMGLARIALLVLGDAWRWSHLFRSALGVFSCFFWVQMVFALLIGPRISAALAVYPWMVVAEFYCTYRAAQEHAILHAELRARAENGTGA